MTDLQLTKTPSNICAGIAQQAASIVGDMMSAYWSTSEDKPIPGVFISQTEERIRIIQNMLVMLKASKEKKAK